MIIDISFSKTGKGSLFSSRKDGGVNNSIQYKPKIIGYRNQFREHSQNLLGWGGLMRNYPLSKKFEGPLLAALNISRDPPPPPNKPRLQASEEHKSKQKRKNVCKEHNDLLSNTEKRQGKRGLKKPSYLTDTWLNLTGVEEQKDPGPESKLLPPTSPSVETRITLMQKREAKRSHSHYGREYQHQETKNISSSLQAIFLEEKIISEQYGSLIEQKPLQNEILLETSKRSVHSNTRGTQCQYNFRKISVRNTIWDLEFSVHLLSNFLLASLSLDFRTSKKWYNCPFYNGFLP